MTFLNKLKSARVGKIFARWHLAIAITSIIILEYGSVSTEVHLTLIAQQRTVMPHYKNSGLCLSFSTVMSLPVYKFFKRMISSSNFVAIAQLVVLARKDPGTTSPFASVLGPVTLTCIFFSLRALRKVNTKNESSIGTCPTSLLSALVSTAYPSCSLAFPARQRLPCSWRQCCFVNMFLFLFLF